MEIKIENLIEEIASNAQELLHRKNKALLSVIKKRAEEKGMLGGTLVEILTDKSKLEETNVEDILLIADVLSESNGDYDNLNLKNWIPVKEIIKLKKSYHPVQSLDNNSNKSIKLSNVSQSESDVYTVTLDYKVLAEWMINERLTYNFENQRSAIVKKSRTGKEYKIPRVYTDNVNEIASSIEKGDLRSTLIWINCPIGSTKDESGFELLYDDISKELEITEGTAMEILDGMHRLSGILEAYKRNPKIQGNMIVNIANFDDTKAKSVQAQLAKATPFDKDRARELAQEGMSATVIEVLKRGDLKDKISTVSKGRRVNEVVGYSTLENAINKYFQPKNRLEAIKLGEELNEYMMYLFGEFYEKQKENVLFLNDSFYAHLHLFKKMKDNSIPYEKLTEYFKKMNISKENPLWTMTGVNNSRKILGNKVAKELINQIDDIFNNNKEVS